MAANENLEVGVHADDEGNVYKMRDYELLEQTEVQTAGSTDYFVLEDVNGGYHKILKSSVMGIVRDALGELVNSRDKTTGAKSALVLDNNNDLGTSSINALAQMLGVKTDGRICFVRDTVNKNMDTMLPSSYILERQPNIQGTFPTDALAGGNYVVVYITCIVNNTNYGYQEYLAFNFSTGGNKKWHRYKMQGTWQSWTLEFDS